MEKSEENSLENSVVASDAFSIADGCWLQFIWAKAVIQPGGSVKDDEVIKPQIKQAFQWYLLA